MTAKTVKAVNYTPEQTATMVEMYSADKSEATVKTLAEMYGKTVRSIVAKLSREKVYVAKEYKTKTGEAVTSKNDLADKIAAMVGGFTESETESLTKANKTALDKILACLS